MTMDERNATRRSLPSKGSLHRNAACAAGPVKSAEFERSGFAVNGPVRFLDNAPTRTPFEAIEDQRLKLLNVLDIVHCISVGVADGDEHPGPEIPAAFDLLECEIQRIAAALEENSLRSAMKARSGSRRFPRPA
jgi:hypothetical protein